MPTPDDLRVAVSSLAVLAAGDLRRLWRETSTPSQVETALKDVLPALVAAYGQAAATVAADWYDDLRDEQNVDGRFFAITADLGDMGTSELAGWAIGPLYGADPDIGRTRTMVEGGMQRRIANAARQTITTSSVEDPKAQGWQRSAAGGCSFCRMLAARGAVYTESSVDFASHDHCNCVAVPAFDGRERPVKPYTPSSRDIPDADRARVRDYLASHDAG